MDPSPAEPPPTHHGYNPVISFIIGLAIILLASILNAAGLNLTKLDHVRRLATSAIGPLTPPLRFGQNQYQKLRRRRIGRGRCGY